MSDAALISAYHSQTSIDVRDKVKQELAQRRLIDSSLDKLISAKDQEIDYLKNELEKYKMSEKIATSILESPYNYGSSSNLARR